METKLYSQNKEELFINDYFKSDTGVYLEIGGYNPFTFSNTRKLYERGWKGIIIEPSPECFLSFVREYKFDKNILLLNVAIAEHNGKIDFYNANGDAVATTCANHKEKWEKDSSVVFDKIEVSCITFDVLLKQISEFTQKVDFLNLDVEGCNIDIFMQIPDSFLSDLSMICIEHDSRQDKINSRLQGFGFRLLHENGENLIYVK